MAIVLIGLVDNIQVYKACFILDFMGTKLSLDLSKLKYSDLSQQLLFYEVQLSSKRGSQ